MLAELYAASVSNPGFNVRRSMTSSSDTLGGDAGRQTDEWQWICSPACTELEQVTMDWCARMLGLGDDFLLEKKQGGGVIMVGLAIDTSLTRPGISIGIRSDGCNGGQRKGSSAAFRAALDRVIRGKGEVRSEIGHVRKHTNALSRSQGVLQVGVSSKLDTGCSALGYDIPSYCGSRSGRICLARG